MKLTFPKIIENLTTIYSSGSNNFFLVLPVPVVLHMEPSAKFSVMGITSIVSLYINSNDSFDLRHSLICTQILGNSLYRKFVVFLRIDFLNQQQEIFNFFPVNRWKAKKKSSLYLPTQVLYRCHRRPSLSLSVNWSYYWLPRENQEGKIDQISTITTFIVLSNKKHTWFSSYRRKWSI